MNDFASRWWGGGLRRLIVLAGVAGWSHAAAGQVAFNPSAQLWPSSADGVRPSVTIFGSAVACTLVTCDPAPSFGFDFALRGPFRAAVAGPRSSPQLGVSYTWRQIDIATRIGQGATVVRPRKPGPHNTIRDIRTYGDTLGGLRAETTYTTDDATGWSSAEARLTWRQERWWASALVGRVAVAQQGTGLWAGLQLGADLGRGASLLIGASSSPQLLATDQPRAGGNTLSLGFGFNAGVFSWRSGGATPNSANAAFVISPAGAGRVRIAIRVAADSVEFASDCTQWRAVQMTRDGDRWAVEVAAAAGLHRANVRVNGGRWMSPPGLASMDDDFAGEVGIFVIQ